MVKIQLFPIWIFNCSVSFTVMIIFLRVYCYQSGCYILWVCSHCILFHWTSCLLLWQYCTILITGALHYALISGTISPLALFTFFKIVMAIFKHLHTHIEFIISFPTSIYTKNKKKPKACYNSDWPNMVNSSNLWTCSLCVYLGFFLLMFCNLRVEALYMFYWAYPLGICILKSSK